MYDIIVAALSSTVVSTIVTHFTTKLQNESEIEKVKEEYNGKLEYIEREHNHRIEELEKKSEIDLKTKENNYILEHANNIFYDLLQGNGGQLDKLLKEDRQFKSGTFKNNSHPANKKRKR